MTDRQLSFAVGVSALAGPGLHLLSDLMELLQRGFSHSQLVINYCGFALIPFMVMGLYALQAKRSGWMGFFGAFLYGLSFIFFAGTAFIAWFQSVPDYGLLLEQLGTVYTAHGIMMIIGGFLFGISIVRARVFPRWTGILLMSGIGVNLFVGISGLPEMLQIAGSTLRNIAFMSMGTGLVLSLVKDK